MALRAGYYGVTRKMLEYIKQGGGPSCDVKSGTIEISDSEPTKVTLGFKPDIVYVWSGKGNNKAGAVYNGLFKDNKQFRSWDYGSYLNNLVSWDLPYTGSDGQALKSIDDDGFTVLKWSGDYTDGTINYVAYKQKEEN